MKIHTMAAIVLMLNTLCNAMKYDSLKEQVEITHVKNALLPYVAESLVAPTTKREKEEYHEAFVKEYKKQFNIIWNDTASNKIMYENAKNKPYENIRIINRTLNEFVLIRMQNSYKSTLKKFYPKDHLFKIEALLDKGHNHIGETLQDQAAREVDNYLNNDTCTGCCWLLCLGSR